jgi:hypothetical protein
MRSRLRHGDLLAPGILLAATGFVLAYWFRHDAWLSEYDVLSYFLPWFGETGARLRAGFCIRGRSVFERAMARRPPAGTHNPGSAVLSRPRYHGDSSPPQGPGRPRGS